MTARTGDTSETPTESVPIRGAKRYRQTSGDDASCHHHTPSLDAAGTIHTATAATTTTPIPTATGINAEGGSALSALPDVLQAEIASLVGATVLDLGEWAQCSRAERACTLRLHCQYCGRTPAYALPLASDGRVAHAASDARCTWPDALDVCRPLYPLVDWATSFVAGGWAAFLHFSEHRQHAHAWRHNGRARTRTLEVWTTSPAALAQRFAAEHKIISDAGSTRRRVRIDFGRVETAVVAKTNMDVCDVTDTVTATTSRPHAHVEIVSFKMDGSEPLATQCRVVLEQLPLPWLRVAFVLKGGGREWVLSTTHSARAAPLIITREDLDDVEKLHGKKIDVEALVSIYYQLQQKMEQRVLQHHAFGYPLPCSCPATSHGPTSSGPKYWRFFEVGDVIDARVSHVHFSPRAVLLRVDGLFMCNFTSTGYA